MMVSSGNALALTPQNAPKAPVITSSATYSTNGEYMTSLTDSRGNTASYTYNESRGYVKSETDAKGNTTSYAYTPGEQLSSVTAGGSTVSYGYTKDVVRTEWGSTGGISEKHYVSFFKSFSVPFFKKEQKKVT